MSYNMVQAETLYSPGEWVSDNWEPCAVCNGSIDLDADSYWESNAGLVHDRCGTRCSEAACHRVIYKRGDFCLQHEMENLRDELHRHPMDMELQLHYAEIVKAMRDGGL